MAMRERWPLSWVLWSCGNREQNLSSWIFSLVQFFPISLFAAYAFWDGVPSNERWMDAFTLGAVAALVQLAILIPQRRPLNRLILAANLYLLAGGFAPVARQWWIYSVYGSLRESGIILMMMLVGLISTFASSAGYIGVLEAQQADIKRSSMILLAATGMALVPAMVFEGNRLFAAVLPIAVLAVVQRYLVRQLDARRVRA